ncbi:hypothetical protein BC629DRAFT_853374 [Irpex lacteus]|nr:hypothetical protein BC629DRAFT_853374 [Irpex lacteus]
MPPAEHELRVELCRTIVAYDDEIAQLREDLEESQQELDKTRKSQAASKKRAVKLEVQLSESKSRVQELEEQLTEEKRRTEEYESSGCQAEIQQLLVRTQNTLKLTKARLDEENARSRQGQVLIMTLRQQVAILEQRGRDDGQQISDLQEELKEAESLTKTAEPNLAACMHEVLVSRCSSRCSMPYP